MTTGDAARSRRVTVARVESGEPMGQQEADTQLIRALRTEGVEMRVLSFIGWREHSSTGRRIWLSGPSRLPAVVHPTLALHAYGRGGVVHRLDGRLPPARTEIVTIQDVAPLKFDDEGDWPSHCSGAARRAAAVVVPSASSAEDVRTLLGVERVRVIPLGVDAACWAAGPLTASDRRGAGLEHRRYVLYAGGSSQRKNLAALAGAWRRVAPAHPDLALVICGPESSAKRDLFGKQPGCLVLGKVDRALLLRLMASAAAVVVPSVYEGFGLPVLEAMATATVVVAARASSLPEVGGDAALLVEPTADGLAAGIAAAVDGDHGRRVAAGALWARRFTWTETARRYIELYEEIGAAQASSTR